MQQMCVCLLGPSCQVALQAAATVRSTFLMASATSWRLKVTFFPPRPEGSFGISTAMPWFRSLSTFSACSKSAQERKQQHQRQQQHRSCCSSCYQQPVQSK